MADRFAPLVAAHSRAAYQAAYRVLGDVDLALDVVQESLLALHARRADVPDDAAGAWLWRTATNKALDQYRRRRVRAAPGDPGALIDAAPGPSDVTLAGESRDAVIAALEQLSPRQREVVMRRALDGQSFVALAGELGISEGAAKVHFRRGLAALRDRLTELEPLRRTP